MRTERNMKIHIAAALIVFIAAALLQLERMDWLFLLLAVALVLITELVNTSVEAVIDFISLEEHPLARVAKDTAAGAALVAAVFAIIVGLIVFGKPVYGWIHAWIN